MHHALEFKQVLEFKKKKKKPRDGISILTYQQIPSKTKETGRVGAIICNFTGGQMHCSIVNIYVTSLKSNTRELIFFSREWDSKTNFIANNVQICIHI